MTDRGPKNRARGPQGAPVPPRTAESGSEIACDLLDLEAFDDVAFADIVVILERHAALVARLDLAHVVLEALALLEAAFVDHDVVAQRSEEHTSEPQSLMRISYAVFCLKKKKQPT